MAQARRKRMTALLTVGLLLAGLLPIAADAPEPRTAKGEQRYAASGFQFDGDAVYDEAEQALKVSGSARLRLSLRTEQAGSYTMALEYRLDAQGGKPLELQLSVNGGAPAAYELPRVYRDVTDGTFERDEQGNDIRPAQETVSDYVTGTLRQADYRAAQAYCPALREGDNTVELQLTDQRVSIRCLVLSQPVALTPYQKPAGFQESGETIDIEAEYPSCKSGSLLYPLADRTSPANSPYHYAQLRLNTLGGGNWKTPGQWVTWEIPVEKAGYYSISLRFRQNITRGMQSFRRVYIDGEVPCAELEAYAFRYDRDWQTVTLGSETEDFYFFLDAGTHTLTLEATMGDTVQLYEQLEDAIQQLNALYLQIIKITGASPDLYRTYHLAAAIPGLTESTAALRDTLRAMVTGYEQAAGGQGSELSVLLELASLLDSYTKDGDKIASTLSTFHSHISTLSTLLNTLTQQPLLLDRIRVSGSRGEALPVKASFWDSLINGIKSFFASFLTDYTVLGKAGEGERALSVWLTSSRDQANLLKSMLDEDFTPQSGIRVQLSLVDSGLTEAVMAGRGPDVALGVGRTVPIDMGARGALTDLTEYAGFETLRSRFQSSALNPYTYKDRVFGLPETQDFYMMYVRTDILEPLGVTPPETWDDLPGVITTLSQQNMEIGIPQALLGSLLVQNGLSYYQPGFEKTVFSTQEAYDVYAQYIAFYRDYKQPYNYNAANRFKTGVMPIVFDLLSFYNTMAVLAPEIKGQWEVYALPGVRQPDGSIRRSGDATGVASILLKDCRDKEAGFAFLDWWTSEETQYQYGTDLENLLGPAGRYATANTAAFDRLNWSASQTRRIQAQRETLCEIPEIPGSYIITRNLTNLFLDVMANGAILRESMLRYADVMEEELARKKIEMDLLETA